MVCEICELRFAHTIAHGVRSCSICSDKKDNHMRKTKALVEPENTVETTALKSDEAKDDRH